MLRILFVLAMLVGNTIGIMAQTQEETKQVQEIISVFTTQYYRPITTQEILEGVVKGFRQSLDDPYIEYYSVKAYEKLKQELASKYQGIGAMIKFEHRSETIALKHYSVEDIRDGKVKQDDTKQGEVKTLTVIAPLQGGPAEKAGLKAGDIIQGIDGEENLQKYDLPEVVQRLRGPKGSKVLMKVFRPATRENLNIEVVREEFTYHGLTYKILPDGIGYIHCQFFPKGFSQELQKTLGLLQEGNIKSLVLDLRGCSGGFLEEVMSIAGLFLGPGPVFRLQTREGATEKTLESQPSFTKTMVVLIDKNTSSGAELLAGALKDRGRAILVGQRTFGKGSIQKLVDLADGSALKLTTAHYLTPNGNVVEKSGVTPDIEMVEENQQLTVALALAKVIK